MVVWWDCACVHVCVEGAGAHAPHQRPPRVPASPPPPRPTSCLFAVLPPPAAWWVCPRASTTTYCSSTGPSGVWVGWVERVCGGVGGGGWGGTQLNRQDLKCVCVCGCGRGWGLGVLAAPHVRAACSLHPPRRHVVPLLPVPCGTAPPVPPEPTAGANDAPRAAGLTRRWRRRSGRCWRPKWRRVAHVSEAGLCGLGR